MKFLIFKSGFIIFLVKHGSHTLHFKRLDCSTFQSASQATWSWRILLTNNLIKLIKIEEIHITTINISCCYMIVKHILTVWFSYMYHLFSSLSSKGNNFMGYSKKKYHKIQSTNYLAIIKEISKSSTFLL